MADDFVIFAIASHESRNVNGDNPAWFDVFERGAQKANIIINMLNNVHKENKVVGFKQCRVSIKNIVNEDTSFAVSRFLQGVLIKIASVYGEPEITLDQLANNPVTTSDIERFADGMSNPG